MTIKNAKEMPKIFYGMHFVPGVAQYDEKGKSFRVFVNERAIKDMNPTFAGRPVYVQHVDEVNLENLQNEADGYVIESFYNKADGKTWAKFIVVSDKGHNAIKLGWKLSNAYHPKSFAGPGLCNGVEYDKEITAGEFEHLAIVQNPRYEQSVILTPEQFKEYNAQKELELNRLTNSIEKKKGALSMFNFFKKTKVENSADLEGVSVTLPKSKKEITLEKLINEYDEMGMKDCYANGDHKVKVGEEEMTVNELVEKHLQLKSSMAAPKVEEKKENMDKSEDKAIEKKAEEIAAHEKKEIAEKKENSEEKKEGVEEKKSNSIDHFTDLKNAGLKSVKNEIKIELPGDALARGKERY